MDSTLLINSWDIIQAQHTDWKDLLRHRKPSCLKIEKEKIASILGVADGGGEESMEQELEEELEENTTHKEIGGEEGGSGYVKSEDTHFLSPKWREALEAYLPVERTTFIHPDLRAKHSSLSRVDDSSPIDKSPPVTKELHLPILTDEPAYHVPSPNPDAPLPHVTLTYASSMDAQISLAPGQQTVLSGIETKAMTHYLRSRHDAILVGVGTVEADNPSLNCRYDEATGDLTRQPIPLILDPSHRWHFSGEEKVFRLYKEGKGRGVRWLFGDRFDGTVHDDDEYVDKLGLGHGSVKIEPCAGYLKGKKENGLDWETLLKHLASQGIRSIMIEGGGEVIKDLLREQNQKFVSSVIVTIAPAWLGKGGVEVIPNRSVDDEGNESKGMKLKGTKWIPMGSDVVCCGFLGETGMR